MCITQTKRYNRPIKKAYKVLQYYPHDRNNWIGPFTGYQYKIGRVNSADYTEDHGIHFFASKAAAKHYLNRLEDCFDEYTYKLFEAEIPATAIVWKGYSDRSMDFNTKRYPIMYTTTAIKIIGECK